MNKYLVIYQDDDELMDPLIHTAAKIFDRMDMSDCYHIRILRLVLIKGTKLIHCRFLNTWHNPKDPLRMEIRDMITDEVYDVGYGTDH